MLKLICTSILFLTLIIAGCNSKEKEINSNNEFADFVVNSLKEGNEENLKKYMWTKEAADFKYENCSRERDRYDGNFDRYYKSQQTRNENNLNFHGHNMSTVDLKNSDVQLTYSNLFDEHDEEICKNLIKNDYFLYKYKVSKKGVNQELVLYLKFYSFDKKQYAKQFIIDEISIDGKD
jgi:hypothetical protein